MVLVPSLLDLRRVIFYVFYTLSFLVRFIIYVYYFIFFLLFLLVLLLVSFSSSALYPFIFYFGHWFGLPIGELEYVPL